MMEMVIRIPTITTPRLLLRPFTLADLHPLFDILQEPDIFKYFPRPGPFSDRRTRHKGAAHAASGEQI